jgi:1,2-diacylglycerol 3-alpha-glucosyltransferase
VADRVRKDIPEVLLLIAGAGPAREGLGARRQQIGVCPTNAMFIGYLDRHTELNSCYHSADIFVFSSRTETQGLVLLEAMAQGVPVVSTAEMGTRDVLREGAGVWIAEEELEDFSGKVIKMLGDATESEHSLGEAGREYAHGWSARQTRQSAWRVFTKM